MKKAHLKELAGQLLGNVTDHPDVLDHFSTDGSMLRVTPQAVVYPNNTTDVRKTVSFAAARTAAGKPTSVTVRGKGTGRGGGALGEGLVLVTPAHLDKLLRLDRDTVTVQPGILYKTLQQTLHTHGRFVPSYPADVNTSTAGAVVATNAAGEKSIKYGDTRAHVKRLKVVLADGSLIETGRISARELRRKKGLTTLEGDIYRQLDGLILDHAALIASHQPPSKPMAGYALGTVRGKDGSFDLTQAFIGSNGTLGAITEITLKTAPHNPRTTLVAAYCDDLKAAVQAIAKLSKLGPSALELVNYHLLSYLREHHPGDLGSFVPEKLPKLMLLIEFDNFSQFTQKLKSNQARRILAKHEASVRITTDPVEQVALWKIRRGAGSAMWMRQAAKQPLPLARDTYVPVQSLDQFFDKAYKFLVSREIEPLIWGTAGGTLHTQLFADPSKRREVDRLMELAQEFDDVVIGVGAMPHGDITGGLLPVEYYTKLYDPKMLELFAQTKRVFDPHSIFNPAHHIQATRSYAHDHIRVDYRPGHRYDYV